MEENRIETPLSEMDSNLNTVGDISTEEANQAANEVESTSTTCEVSDDQAIAEAQEPMNFDFGMPLDPDVLRAYRELEQHSLLNYHNVKRCSRYLMTIRMMMQIITRMAETCFCLWTTMKTCSHI